MFSEPQSNTQHVYVLMYACRFKKKIVLKAQKQQVVSDE